MDDLVAVAPPSMAPMQPSLIPALQSGNARLLDPDPPKQKPQLDVREKVSIFGLLLNLISLCYVVCEVKRHHGPAPSVGMCFSGAASCAAFSAVSYSHRRGASLLHCLMTTPVSNHVAGRPLMWPVSSCRGHSHYLCPLLASAPSGIRECAGCSVL